MAPTSSALLIFSSGFFGQSLAWFPLLTRPCIPDRIILAPFDFI
jgi:hypothetical protein